MIRSAFYIILNISYYFENISESYINAFWSVAYAGILSSGVAYTLQIIAQKYRPHLCISDNELGIGLCVNRRHVVIESIFNIREILGSVMVFSYHFVSAFRQKTCASKRQSEIKLIICIDKTLISFQRLVDYFIPRFSYSIFCIITDYFKFFPVV